MKGVHSQLGHHQTKDDTWLVLNSQQVAILLLSESWAFVLSEISLYPPNCK